MYLLLLVSMIICLSSLHENRVKVLKFHLFVRNFVDGLKKRLSENTVLNFSCSFFYPRLVLTYGACSFQIWSRVRVVHVSGIDLCTTCVKHWFGMSWFVINMKNGNMKCFHFHIILYFILPLSKLFCIVYSSWFRYSWGVQWPHFQVFVWAR